MKKRFKEKSMTKRDAHPAPSLTIERQKQKIIAGRAPAVND